jgi:hypothetical protein
MPIANWLLIKVFNLVLSIKFINLKVTLISTFKYNWMLYLFKILLLFDNPQMNHWLESQQFLLLFENEECHILCTIDGVLDFVHTIVCDSLCDCYDCIINNFCCVFETMKSAVKDNKLNYSDLVGIFIQAILHSLCHAINCYSDSYMNLTSNGKISIIFCEYC